MHIPVVHVTLFFVSCSARQDVCCCYLLAVGHSEEPERSHELTSFRVKY